MSEDLSSTVDKYIVAWRKMSRVYAAISVLLRGTLIVGSALVAAKLGLQKFLCEPAAVAISVYVAVGTALEAWLKPREKWKGFMTDCENAEDLSMRLKNTETSDPKIDNLRQEFQTILATHREKNVF